MRTVLLAIILIIQIGCDFKLNDDPNELYKESLSFFKDDFVSHFPDGNLENDLSFQFQTNTSKDFDCIYLQFSAVFEEKKVSQLLDSLAKVSLATYRSTDTCLLIVNRFHSKKNLVELLKVTEEDNKRIDWDCLNNKLPLPNFYLSHYTSKGTECGLEDDFILYVLDARHGKFWDDKYLYGGKFMPNLWEHGYSKGIAISKMKKAIIFWFVIW